VRTYQVGSRIAQCSGAARRPPRVAATTGEEPGRFPGLSDPTPATLTTLDCWPLIRRRSLIE
jgi:hypothetical protein